MADLPWFVGGWPPIVDGADLTWYQRTNSIYRFGGTGALLRDRFPQVHTAGKLVMRNRLRSRLCVAMFGVLAAVACLAPPVHAQSAIVIGNATYPTADWDDLQAVQADRANADSTLPGCGWNVETHANLTSAGMGDAIGPFLASTVPLEDGILYYSGHGCNTVAGQGSWVGINDLGSNDLLSPSDMVAMFGGLLHPLGKVVFIIDSCGSGGFASILDGLLAAAGTSAVFFAATPTVNECAFTKSVAEGRHFTFWVMKGLRGAADGCGGNPSDGNISADELDCYLDANYDPTQPDHLYIANGGGNHILHAGSPVSVETVTFGRVKSLFR